MINDKKVLFSGMQATGTLTLGNYLGALKNWVTLSEDYECFYSVVDLHSITVRQNPTELRQKARNLLALYIAAGLDPEKNTIFIQIKFLQTGYKASINPQRLLPLHPIFARNPIVKIADYRHRYRMRCPHSKINTLFSFFPYHM